MSMGGGEDEWSQGNRNQFLVNGGSEHQGLD